MELYCGIDLHSNNSYVVVLEPGGRRRFARRLANDLAVILAALAPFRAALAGIAVESTYNWYWLVDGLMAAGYRVHLANPAAMKRYEGLKHVDDRSDADWLGRSLALGILPEGYIYPAAERPLRDLLRRRSHLVRQRTANILSVQNQLVRATGRGLSAQAIKRLAAKADQPEAPGAPPQTLGAQPELAAMADCPELVLAIGANLAVIATLGQEIARLERAALARTRPRDDFRRLLAVAGIGKALGLTILLETGQIGRFATVGNYASYCRLVGSRWISNAKPKGAGNTKCANKYLEWAYVEGGHFATRYEPRAKRYYRRKRAKTNVMVAKKAVAHKLARGCFYVLRDGTPFDPERCFG
jgi:transposase